MHHEHTWVPVSSHATSDGVVTYQRCGCGSWRILRALGLDEVLR